jgi:DNA polymerase-3 subunit delta'
VSFADLQDSSGGVELLQRSLRRSRLGHAYLFTGEDPALLESAARTLAKTLNCQAPPAADGATGVAADCCDHCLNCRRIDANLHPDVLWIRPESKIRIISIDQVRDVIHTVNLKPTEAEWKVAIIVAADRMNPQSANAFLKTLEEPPGRCVLILTSDRPQRLLETILSRCLRLSFSTGAGLSLDPAHRAWLLEFARDLSQPTRSRLGRYCALGKLLQRLSDTKAEIEKDQTTRSPLERYDDVEPGLREKWESELTAAVEAEYRRQRQELLASLQWFFRDVWLNSLKVGRELLVLPELEDAARTLAGRLKPQAALQNLNRVGETQKALDTNVQEALLLEVLLLRLNL